MDEIKDDGIVADETEETKKEEGVENAEAATEGEGEEAAA